MKTSNNPQYRVQVADRILDILEVLSGESSELTQTEMAQKLQLPKSTLHRLLSVLDGRGYVETNSDNGKYRLGLKLFELGSKVAVHLNIGERAGPYLEQLVFESGEAAHLCIYADGEVVYLKKKEPGRGIRMASAEGGRNPVHCTAVGKAILAFLPEEEVDNVIRKRGLQPFTRKTITTPLELKAELKRIRECGYALDDEEHEDGVKCISAPVRDSSDRVMASVSIAGPAFRFTDERTPALVSMVLRVANQISAGMGYRPAAA